MLQANKVKQRQSTPSLDPTALGTWKAESSMM
jgi:hypothetical protein